MRSEFSEIGLIIRRLALTAPAIALSQSACTLLPHGSCDGFESQRIENRFVVSPADGGTDAGVPTSPLACDDFCAQHGTTGGGPVECRVEDGADAGDKVVVCVSHTMCEGRRPDGYEAPNVTESGSLLGRYFATMAAVEAASVTAFERLAAELRDFGFPAPLTAQALAAAGEEARHFRMTAALARRFGKQATVGRVAPRPGRNLLDVARENMREGVVRETFGAVVGWYQSRHARERAVRRVMGRIAHDETSHAVFSWAVNAALRQRLSSQDRERLDEARKDALHELARAVENPVPEELVEWAGLPPPSVARALMDEARGRLFDHASL